jgi:hypothetical protein
MNPTIKALAATVATYFAPAAQPPASLGDSKLPGLTLSLKVDGLSSSDSKLTISALDPREGQIIARMRERLLNGSKGAIPQGDPEIDKIALERLSKQHFDYQLLTTLELCIANAMIDGEERFLALVKGATVNLQETGLPVKQLNELITSLDFRSVTTKPVERLSSLHGLMREGYPDGFMKSPATEYNWEVASGLFNQLLQMPLTLDSNLVLTRNLVTAQLLEHLDVLFPGRYLGEPRTKLMHTDPDLRGKYLREQVEFFEKEYEQARAFKR